MNIWLVTVGEPLPIDAKANRLLRTGMVAYELARRGHEVTWWCSTFDHYRKKHRFKQNHALKLRENLTLRMMHGPGYKKNVSARRFVHHHLVNSQFKRAIEDQVPPDLIVAALPLVELCESAIEYAQFHSVPIVLDLRDMWPDIFMDVCPPYARGILRLSLQQYFRSTERVCRNATALMGITPGFLDWGLQYAGRNRSENDSHFYHAYPSRDTAPIPPEAFSFWKKQGLNPDEHFIGCFFSVMSNKLDLETVISSAKILKERSPNVRFVLCGSGDKFDYYKNLAQSCPNVLLPGWVGGDEIRALLELSDVALAPFRNRKDFMFSIPNKVAEYLSAGLPVLSSLEGELRELNEKNNFGAHYESGSGKSLAEIIMKCQKDESLMATWRANAGDLFRREFTVEHVIGQMADYMESFEGWSPIQCHMQVSREPELWAKQL